MIGTMAIATPAMASSPSNQPASITATPVELAIAPSATALIAPVAVAPPATIQQNPLPRPELNVAANLMPAIVPEAAIAPESLSSAIAPESLSSPAPFAIQPEYFSNQGFPQLVAAVESESSQPEATDAERWQAPPPEEPDDWAFPMSVPDQSQTKPTAPDQRQPPAVTNISNPTTPIDADDDLGSFGIRPIPLEDEDFGKVPIRNLPPPPPPRPKWLFVAANIGYFGNSNAFSTTAKQADGIVRTGLTFTVLPALGPKTYFLGGIDGNIVRYSTYSDLNYDELRLRAGILLSPRMYGEIGWSNQKLYAAKDGFRSLLSGNRFLIENSLRLELSRTDPITKRLSLSSFYQLRWSLSSQSQSDRLSNTVFTSLNYKLSPSWTTGVDYFISWSHYTQVSRDEVFQQVQLRTRYALNPSLSMSLFGGFSFGGSSDDRPKFGPDKKDRLQYDGWSIGVTFAYSQGVF
jgi:hypothetical protein